MAARVPAASASEEAQGGSHDAAALLGLPAVDAVSLATLVGRGLRYAALDRFRKDSALSLTALASMISVNDRTLARRKTEGRLQPEESDRLFRAARVFARALDLFEGDRGAARTWLMQPQRALAGKVPLELATTDVGAREVENLIGRLEHGVTT